MDTVTDGWKEWVESHKVWSRSTKPVLPKHMLTPAATKRKGGPGAPKKEGAGEDGQPSSPASVQKKRKKEVRPEHVSPYSSRRGGEARTDSSSAARSLFNLETPDKVTRKRREEEAVEMGAAGTMTGFFAQQRK